MVDGLWHRGPPGAARLLAAIPVSLPQGAAGASVDVLFSPSGAVITPSLTQDKVLLWVRQPDTQSPNQGGNPNNVFSGTPTIIAVFAQTGLVGAYPPVPGATPYQDVR